VSASVSVLGTEAGIATFEVSGENRRNTRLVRFSGVNPAEVPQGFASPGKATQAKPPGPCKVGRDARHISRGPYRAVCRSVSLSVLSG